MTWLPPAVRRRRWLIAGLIASLALNAFFIGLAATDVALRAAEPRKRPLHFELRWLEGRLPEAGLERVIAAVEATRPEIRRHIDRLRERRVELGNLVAAPAPDRAAIDAKLAEIRGEVDSMLAEIQETTVTELVALPPGMRAELADRNGP